MSVQEKRLTELPVLSQVQQIELTQHLPISTRVLYTVVSTLAIWLMFVLTVSIAVVAVMAIFHAFMTPITSLSDGVMIVFPIVVTYIAVIGFSNHPAPTNILPGDSLSGLVMLQARSGLIRGFIGGTLFSIIWNLAMQLGNLYIELNTIYSVDFELDEMLVYSLLMGALIAPTFALFRSFTAVISHMTLYWLAREEVHRHMK